MFRKFSTYPFSGLVVERPGHINGARHILDGKRTAYVTACDLVSNTRRWKENRINIKTLNSKQKL